VSPSSLSFVAIAPLLMAIALGVGVTTFHRRLPPAMAARVVLTTLVVVVAAVLPTLWTVAVGSLVHVPMLAVAVEWCSSSVGIGRHGSLSAGVATVAAAVFAIVSSARMVRVVRAHQRLSDHLPGPLEIAEHHAPFAVTLPGRGGRVVVSTALLAMLSDDEQAVVLAHEGAHAAHRHDRYLLAAQLGAIAAPVLHPLTQRLKFVLERWADEVAAQRCGDRRLVARTLGKVALGANTFSAPDASWSTATSAISVGATNFACLGVTDRVAALLAPTPPSPSLSARVLVWSAIGATAALALFQLHHLATVVLACMG
jgi:hypothetical protein